MKLTLQFALVLFLQYSITFAQPGQLDLSFNPNGVGAFGGTLPPNYQPEVDGLVYKSKIYTSGPHKDKIIIIGRFTSFNGVPRKYIARLFPDGTVDASFANPALTTGYLYCVEILPSGKILIGGVFTVVGTTAIKNIARLNADGTVDTSFNPAPTGTRGTNAEVHALTMQDDGKILIGGVFTLFNGAGNKRLVRLNPDGTQDATFNATGTPTGEIRVIALQKTGANAGKIIVGGFFTGFTGYTKNKILRLLPNGDFDPTFNTTGNGATGGDAVFDVYVRPDDSMYAVGKFTKYNNVDKRSIVFLNAEGGLVTAFNPGGIGVSNAESSIGTGSGYNIFAILPQPDGKLLIGGNFTQYNGTNIPKGITRLTDNGLLDDTFLTGAGFTGGTEVYQGKSVVRHITLQVDGKILVSGDFTQYNNTDRRMLARIKTAVCGDLAEFTSDNTWINGIAPTGDSYYTVISGGVCTISVGANIEVCELELRAGATLLIEPHASITIKNRIINNGTIIVEDSGSLVQINDSSDNSDQGTGTFI
ncbi:MAG TPA: delta-60 repeat domain-containing protein, partial [Flavobacterium sp.]